MCVTELSVLHSYLQVWHNPTLSGSKLLWYSKIPIISPGLISVQKAVLLSLFSEGLIIGRNLLFQNGLGLTIKTA